MPEFISRDELLQTLHELGFKLCSRTLRNWSRMGLIEKPIRIKKRAHYHSNIVDIITVIMERRSALSRIRDDLRAATEPTISHEIRRTDDGKFVTRLCRMTDGNLILIKEPRTEETRCPGTR